MPTVVALAGWPAAEPPAGAWTDRLGDDLPVALATLADAGPPASAATGGEGRLHAVVAGALANRRELERTLGRGGESAGSAGDAALVLRLYEGRGEQSVSALRGGFAIALWDGRRGRLVLARDQLGVQPLYVAAARGHCVAATALAPLLRIPGLAGAPDLACIDVLLALGTVPAPATCYPGVRQVGAGELLVWEPGRLRAQRYWQLRFPEARDVRRTAAGDVVRRAREQLVEAVRVRAAGRLAGLLLSGGVGASAVLAFSAALDRGPFAAATVAADADEAARAAALARRLGVDHRAVAPAVDWVAAADAALAVHGAPLAAMDEALLAPAVAALGERAQVLLLGCGAEDVLGGGPAERTWAGAERYRALPALLRECVDIAAVAGWPRGVAATVRAARSAPVDVFADADVVLGADARRTLYGPELLQVVEGSAPTGRALGALAGDAVSQGASDARDVLYAIRLAVGVGRSAARLVGALPGAAEVAFPLLDPRVAQTAAAMPARARAAVGRRAELLRQAAAPHLPRDARAWRPHRALAPAPAAWRTGSLRALVEDTLAPDHVGRLGLFDPAAVARLRALHAAGRADLGAVLWRLVLLTRWLDAPSRAVADAGRETAAGGVPAAATASRRRA